MDHDEKIGSVKDYNCNDQSYDLLDGYNHRGTDIMLWPFSWNMMDENIINVVAATDGIIIHKMDGTMIGIVVLIQKIIPQTAFLYYIKTDQYLCITI